MLLSTATIRPWFSAEMLISPCGARPLTRVVVTVELSTQDRALLSTVLVAITTLTPVSLVLTVLSMRAEILARWSAFTSTSPAIRRV